MPEENCETPARCDYCGEGKIRRTHCNGCSRETKHILIAVKDESGDDEDYSWRVVDEMLECMGCGDVKLRHRTYYDADGPFIKQFPPPISRQDPRWKYDLPRDVRTLMEEVYGALHAGSRSLASMGARALIDMAANDKVGDVGGFVEKLAALEKEHFISKRNREILSAALESGHAAAHRGYRPKDSEVNAVMDIVENVLQAVYVLESVATGLKRSTPARSKKKAAKAKT